MNREIKFRAWDTQEKCMVCTGFHVFGEVHTFHAIEQHCYETKGEKDGLIRFNDIIISQFTGLHDKNGKEIYEGDIVSVPYVTPMGQVTDVEDGTYRTSVGFENGAFVLLYPKTDNVHLSRWCNRKVGEYIPNYGNRNIIDNTTLVEIIGNIYSNPELLTP